MLLHKKFQITQIISTKTVSSVSHEISPIVVTHIPGNNLWNIRKKVLPVRPKIKTRREWRKNIKANNIWYGKKYLSVLQPWGRKLLILPGRDTINLNMSNKGHLSTKKREKPYFRSNWLQSQQFIKNSHYHSKKTIVKWFSEKSSSTKFPQNSK